METPGQLMSGKTTDDVTKDSQKRTSNKQQWSEVNKTTRNRTRWKALMECSLEE